MARVRARPTVATAEEWGRARGRAVGSAPWSPRLPKLRTALKPRSPGLAVERELWAAGHEVVVGIDEVGRGSWAGPLSVGAAVVPQDRRVYKVRDSKMLTEHEREALFDRIADWCVAWAVGHASQVECDELGHVGGPEAGGPPGHRAASVWCPTGCSSTATGTSSARGNTRRIVKGDATCLSIAAASILAKVTRDRIMRAEAEHFPGYDFEWNKGYPCPRHKMALQGMGPTAIHRRSWVFMDNCRGRACPASTHRAGARPRARRLFD